MKFRNGNLVYLFFFFLACSQQNKTIPETLVKINEKEEKKSFKQPKFIEVEEGNELICFTGYSILHNSGTKIQFQEKTISPKLLKTYSPKNALYLINEWELNSEFKIKHLDPHRVAVDYVKDTLEVFGKKVCFEDAANVIMPHITDIKYFTFFEDSYLLIAIEDNQCNLGLHNCHSVLLVNISDKENIKFLTLADDVEPCSCGSKFRFYPDYLGDFDRDGTLEFLQWRTDTSYSHKIVDHQLVIDKKHYLITHQFSEEGKTFYEAKRWKKINLTKSNWYYPLQKSPDKDTCPNNIMKRKAAPLDYTNFSKHKKI